MATCQFAGVNPAIQDRDPAIIAYRSFQAASAVIAGFCKHSSGDIPNEMALSRHAAYLALMAAPATTPDGVAAKLRASVTLYEASEIEPQALTVPLADLERIANEVSQEPLGSDWFRQTFEEWSAAVIAGNCEAGDPDDAEDDDPAESNDDAESESWSEPLWQVAS